MRGAITPGRWLEFLEAEYLEGFLKDGGSAVKFAVPMEEGLSSTIVDSVCRVAEAHGFITSRIRADSTRIHMIDQMFFRLASVMPWNAMTQVVIERLASEIGYSVPDVSEAPLLEELARVNRVEPRLLLMELRKRISDEVFSQRGMSKDFRVAMTQLCLARLSDEAAGEAASRTLIDWLTGSEMGIAAVRPYFIFNRIGRSNARHFLESLLWWLRFAGLPGLVLAVDIAALAISKRGTTQMVYYTKAGVLDAYEVLREFVDGIDRMIGCLIVVIPDRSFLEEATSRGIDAYPALKARVFDEVRDRHLVNPMASLVRLSLSGGKRARLSLKDASAKRGF